MCLGTIIRNSYNQKLVDPPNNDLCLETVRGVSIPVHGPRGRNGCFSLEFTNTDAGIQNLDIHTMQWAARETQILTWIALGKSNADIADILDISFHTVGTYTRRIFDKTKTNNRTSAALCGISNGLIDV